MIGLISLIKRKWISNKLKKKLESKANFSIVSESLTIPDSYEVIEVNQTTNTVKRLRNLQTLKGYKISVENFFDYNNIVVKERNKLLFIAQSKTITTSQKEVELLFTGEIKKVS